MRAKSFFARYVVTQNISNNRSRFRGSDTVKRMMFGSEKFSRCGNSAPRQASIGTGQIHQSDLGVTKDESSAVVTQLAGKIEAPFLQFEKSLPCAEPANGENGGHIERTSERFAQPHRSEIMAIVILWIVIRVGVTNGVWRVRQETGRGQDPAIECVQVNERF